MLRKLQQSNILEDILHATGNNRYSIGISAASLLWDVNQTYNSINELPNSNPSNPKMENPLLDQWMQQHMNP